MQINMFKTSISSKINNLCGIGVDIEKVDRFSNLDLILDKQFLNHIFTSKEISYCFLKHEPKFSLAVRFAGKEAIKKGLSKISNVNLKDIEILNDSDGSPFVKVNKLSLNIEIEISLSHNDTDAIAFVIISKKFNKFIL